MVQRQTVKSIGCLQLALATCIFSLFLFTPDVCGQAAKKDDNKSKTEFPLNARGIVEFGAQLREIQGGHTAKFEEVRDVPKGFFIPKLRLDFNSGDSPFSLAIRGYEIRERDQRITLDLEKIGKFRTEFMWDQIPHHFGTGQSFLVQTAPGLYQVSQNLRASLEAVTQGDNTRTPVNGPLPTLVRQELRTAPFTESRLRWDTALFRQTYEFSDNIEFVGQFSWVRKRGTRPMSAGTFVRRANAVQGGPDTGGFWEGIGQEFLEPIDWRTYDLKLGVHFNGLRWRAGIDYDLSLFRNRVESLTFENPFRVTDQQGCAPTCGASNRFREVRWQNDLPPNNDSHTITLWANIDVTSSTQVRGLFSLAYWTQNDQFLPWTLNTAIRPIDWDGLTTITNPTDVNQLPARSPNAKLRNINQEYALVNRRNNFRFQAQYRSQFLDSQSPQIIFPGYAAFGDSTWRAARTDFYNLPIENLDWDFRRQNIDAGFDWEFLRHWTWKLDYDWEIWNRKFRDVNRNNQHSIRNRLEFEFNLSGDNSTPQATTTTATGAGPQDAKPKLPTVFRLKIDHTYADRRVIAYNTQPLTFVPNLAGSPANGPTGAWVVTSFTVMNDGFPIEFNLLRRFDETGRIRNDGTFKLELLKGEKTNFSASYRYLGDEYDKNFYGLLYNHFSFIDTQFTHAFDNGAYVYASYSRENNRFSYRDVAHLLPNPVAPPGAIVQGVLAQYPFANTWERTSRSNLDSFQFGVNAAPQEGWLKNWEFDLEYAFSYTKDRISTANPFPVRPDSIVHAGANPYPDTVVRRQDLNIGVTRRINDRIAVGARYWYEPYTQDDFSYNVQAPYIHGQLTSDTPKYMFQDARFASFHANVATFFVRYSF